MKTYCVHYNKLGDLNRTTVTDVDWMNEQKLAELRQCPAANIIRIKEM